MKSITVFCGANDGNQEIFKTQAIILGQILAKNNIRLVYGGSKIGLMGAVAEGALSEGGEAVGVIPNFLGSKEIAHDNLTELHRVNTMHERKLLMHDLCEGVIALPGGFGTLEELFEILTWGQLGLHQKPMGILNIDGYYDHLISFLKNMVDKGLLKEENYDMVLVSDNIEALLEKMKNYVAPEVPKWITKETT